MQRVRTSCAAILAAASLGLAALAVSGCASDPKISVSSLEISPEADANLNNPVALDLVLVFEKDALGQVSSMTAGQWREQRDQLALAFPTGLKVVPFEVAPGQQLLRYSLSSSERNAIGAFVFADYATPGAHRSRVDRFAAIDVKLGQRDFTVSGS